MPHLTLQISARGPIVELFIGVSAPRLQALSAKGEPVPAGRIIRGLIDTGASCTCVDPQILKALNLPPTGQTPIVTSSTGAKPHLCEQYDVGVALLHTPKKQVLHIPALPVIASDLSMQDFQALIGRDVLANCLFVYDGGAGTFSIAF